MLTNSLIPNTMSHKGLEHLARIASSANKGSKILEAGSLYGCSAWVLAKNAPEGAQVYAIDPWEHQGFLNRFKINNHRVPDLSIHAFKAYTYDCDNLTAVQGYSPQAAENLDIENLDVVFEDAAHSYDVLKQNIEYFYPKLNPGGIFCGDDYQSAFPGVIKCVDELAEHLGVKPQVCGQVWAIRKPLEENSSADLYQKVGNLYESEIGVSIETETGEELIASPHCFTPNIFHPKEIAKLSLFWHINGNTKLDFTWKLKFSDGELSSDLKSGETVSLNGRKVVGLKVELVGQNIDNFSVGYQIAETQSLDEEFKEIGPSRERFNGAWLEVSRPSGWIYALSVGLVTQELKHMRKRHASLIKAGKDVGEKLFGDAGKKKR